MKPEPSAILFWRIPRKVGNSPPTVSTNSIQMHFKNRSVSEFKTKYQEIKAANDSRLIHNRGAVSDVFEKSQLKSPTSVLRRRPSSFSTSVIYNFSKNNRSKSPDAEAQGLKSSSQLIGSHGNIIYSKRVTFHESTKPGNSQDVHSMPTEDLFAPGITKSLCSARRRMKQIDQARALQKQLNKTRIALFPIILIVLVVANELSGRYICIFQNFHFFKLVKLG